MKSKSYCLLYLLIMLLLSPMRVLAQEAPKPLLEASLPSTPTKAKEANEEGESQSQETDRIKQEIKQLKIQLEAINNFNSQNRTILENRIKNLEDAQEVSNSKMELARLGTTTFLFSGYAATQYAYLKGVDNNPSVNFNPIILWEISDRLLFETEIGITNSGENTDINLEYANFAYNISPNLVLRFGKFLTPLSYFMEKYHPDWINKMPDRPLHHEAGLLPESSTGIELRGAFAVAVGRMNFAVYLSKNSTAMTAMTAGGGHNHMAMGQADTSVVQPQSKSIGARLGYLPIPGLEFGYAMQQARNGSSWSSPTEGLRATFQEADCNYIRSFSLIRGTIAFRGEWGWSRQEDRNPVPSFEGERNRDGGYAQLSYRASMATNNVLQSLEPVVRFDALSSPLDPAQMGKQQRLSLGLDVWINHNTVFKVAYEKSKLIGLIGGQPSQNHTVSMQAAIGF